MTDLQEDTKMFNAICETFKLSNREGIKNIIITVDRDKQVASSADRMIIKRDRVNIET